MFMWLKWSGVCTSGYGSCDVTPKPEAAIFKSYYTIARDMQLCWWGKLRMSLTNNPQAEFYNCVWDKWTWLLRCLHKPQAAIIKTYYALMRDVLGKSLQSDYTIACDFKFRGSSKVLHKPQAASFQSYYKIEYDWKFRGSIAFTFKPEPTSLKHYHAIVVVF